LITNISTHGARVITHRNWQPHDRAVFMEVTRNIHTEAEVIYCRRLRPDEYVIGLRLGRPAAEMRVRSRS
jgi:hypothetical protein